ncbi:response regulator transcription factor [Christiangramia salexigens]|uniref:response regulator transcription factor n=1 Tax=Christiangramia salexigens TaxID=1913577 RepID=UPI0018DC2854|nr:helix-turn-helix transcriptional regulator [Christiangramia salexigens]
MNSLQEKIKDIQNVENQLPGIIIIRELDSFKPVFISKRGLKFIGCDLKQVWGEEHPLYNSFFRNEDIDDFEEQIKILTQPKKKDPEIHFFQQIWSSKLEDWFWHNCSAKLFHIDPSGPEYLITIANPIDQLTHIPKKMNRLVAENVFFKQNLEKFILLGKREKEVLSLVAVGKSSAEIADELHISFDTVNTHRTNIKEKLKIKSTYGFTQYAQAFDLI